MTMDFLFASRVAVSLEVPSASTTLHYHGQTIDVNIDQFDTLRSLGSGCYGTVLAVMLKSRPEIQMAVKVTKTLSLVEVIRLFAM